MKKTICFACGLSLALSSLSVHAIDVTSELENLGNPNTYITRQSGRNVWDMQVFEGKVYVGSGSTVSNAGPLRIVAYNPATDAFEIEVPSLGATEDGRIGTEAINVFRVFDDVLYLPNADPRSPTSERSKYWRKAPGEDWVEISSTNPFRLRHVRDMIRLPDGRIIGVGNSLVTDEADPNWRPSIVMTADDGATFEGAIQVENSQFQSAWSFGLFSHGGEVFATSIYFSPVSSLQSFGVFRWMGPTEGFAHDPDWMNDAFVPIDDTEFFEVRYRPHIPVELDEALVYPIRAFALSFDPVPGTDIRAVDFYNLRGISFVVKPSPTAPPVNVVFPDADAIGDDVKIHEGAVYALAVKSNSTTDFVNYLYRNVDPANNPQGWEEVLRFSDANRAKSFEILDGYAYFGLGHNFEEPRGNAGTIYRVPMPGSPTLTASSGIFFEAEEASEQSLFSPFEVRTRSDAAGGEYIVVPNGNGNSGGAANITDGILNYSFETASAESVSVWLRGHANNGGDNSVWMRMNNTSWIARGLPVGGSSYWRWRLHRTYNVDAGLNTLQLTYREDGTEIDQVFIGTTGQSPSLGVNDSLYVEAEDAINQSRFSPFEVEFDNGLGSEYIVVPNGTGNNGAASDQLPGRVEYTFALEQASTVVVWIKRRATNAVNDSFHVKLDDGNWVARGTGISSDFTWRRYVTYNNVAAGDHLFRLLYREDGTELDQLFITTDVNATP